MSERSFKSRPQCGLCNAVSNVFRRLLCVGPSRRGSSESYYQQLEPTETYDRDHEDDQTPGEIEDEIRIDPNCQITYVKIRDDQSDTASMLHDEKSSDTKPLTKSDLSLIETMAAQQQDSMMTGRFLTMHKRRRKKLTTRSLTADQAPALLDDVHHGLVKCVLDRVWQWPFNAFTLDVATGGRSLPVLCVHLFHWYGLLDYFKLEVVNVWKLFALIEEGYHSTNPYHNSIHATDVTQAMHCFLQEEKIRKHITPLEIMASLIAAVSHDLDHPGVNQPFLIATSNHLAALYQNTSVLENHHWRSAIGCLLESHVADQLNSVLLPKLERQISSLILATDITRQQEFLTKFKKYLNQNALQMEKEEDRHFILQIALKCADISNPCRPWEISRKWSQKVCEEFFRQGDYEQQLGLPLTALCDRSSSSVPKIQSGFFKFVVIPLFDEWHRFLGTNLSTSMMSHLKTNHNKWGLLLQQELAEETKTEISDADDILMEDSVGTEGDSQCDSRRCSLPSLMLETVDRTGRRHSVPLNLSRDCIAGPSSSGRRESLPSNVEPRHKLVLDPIPHLEEEEEEMDFSFRSSCSGSLQKSSECGSEERPVSAESLLPELSIATITSSLEATRLSNVLHGSTMLAPPVNKILTRQQTFPPIQTLVRTRYLSTAGEIVAQPSASNSSSSNSSRNELCSGHATRTGSSSSEANEGIYLKRDSSSSDSDRGNKMPKFSEKENVNPRRDHESRHHSSLQELQIPRRGSAPVSQEGTSSSRERDKSTPRRGSVPSESTRPDSLDMPRRSSDGNGGKSSRRSSRSRKSLKRRSSGGPDILLPREKLNVPRRGSLPCDVLPTSIKGAEKLLEIWFTGSEEQNDADLRKIPRQKLEGLLKLVHCEVISFSSNEFIDAYILSESSMFVAKRRFILKTCGTTTPLQCLKLLLIFVQHYTGFHEIEKVFYSRKNFKRPQYQHGLYQNFKEEVAFLDSCFKNKGVGYCIKHEDDEWYMYNLQSESICEINKFVGAVCEPDQTIEILMSDLDPAVMHNFRKNQFFKAGEVTKHCGIDKLIPFMEIDDYLFDPCGYSMNGILQNGSYMTIHVTPEPEFSYVSFETNVPLSSYEALIRRVLRTFQPSKFVITLFANQKSVAAGASKELNNLLKVEEGWRQLSNEFCYVGNYDMSVAFYSKFPS